LLDNYGAAVTAVFSEIASLAKNRSENLKRYLKGPVAHSGFTRLA
jgi:hypothetical protein